jgi:hypothetical protein
MKKITLNYIVDIIMFILMMALIGIGFLMKYILVTGQERWVKYGRNVDETLMGLDRHGWGRIHLIIGLILVGVLILHLILHWKSITRFFVSTFGNRALRISFVSALISVTLLLLILPFLVKTEVTAFETGHGHRYRNDPPVDHVKSDSIIPEEKVSSGIKPHRVSAKGLAEEAPHQQQREEREALKAEIEVRGYMTLREISGLYNVQCDQIKERIGIPLSTSDHQQLGQLRRLYGFTMSDVRDAIHAEQQE